MTDFMAENQPAPNGPAPFAPRPEATHLAPATEAGPIGAPGPVNPPDPAPRFAPARPDTRPDTRPDPTRPRPEPGRTAHEVKGRIHIADEVVEKVAALAAMEVTGVADMGGDIERAVESVRERIGLGNKRGDQGVKAEVKGHEVAISVTVMVEYGHVVLDVARQVQANVAEKTQRMLGLKVVEVNVNVDDVRTTRPDEPDEHTAGDRELDAV
ncbi:MAG: Asp23/Gls24 family envelope stress response protein [Acidimicrobiales bacterium]|nr:Asp23/Gls24 family envelope stress response protein [Acidimicrobiales bacterium]